MPATLGRIGDYFRQLRALPPPLRSAAVLAFFWFFCILAFNFGLRPVRDAFGARGATSERVRLFLGTFIAMTVLVPTWSYLVSRLPRRVFVPAAHFALAACLLGFLFTLRADREFSARSGFIFFVWQAVANVFLVSVFWSTMADLLAESEARLLFGPIAAGGTIGGLAGSALPSVFGGRAGVEGYIIGGAVLLIVGAVLMRRLVSSVEAWRRERGEAFARGDAPVAASAIEGLRTLLRSRPLIGLAVFVFAGVVLATFVYFLRPRLLQDAGLPETEQRTLLARASLATQLLALLLQVFLAGPVLRRFGAGAPLALLPLVYVGGFLLYGALPTLAVLIVVEIATRGTAFGLAGPAKDVVYTRVSRAEKYQAKAAIDNWVYRGGDLVGALLFAALETASRVPIGAAAFGLAGLGLLGAFVVARATRWAPDPA